MSDEPQPKAEAPRPAGEPEGKPGAQSGARPGAGPETGPAAGPGAGRKAGPAAERRGAAADAASDGDSGRDSGRDSSETDAGGAADRRTTTPAWAAKETGSDTGSGTGTDARRGPRSGAAPTPPGTPGRRETTAGAAAPRTATPSPAPGRGQSEGRSQGGAGRADRDVTTASAATAGGGGKGKKPRRKRTGWRRLFPTWRMTLGGFLTLVLVGVGLFFLGYSLVKIPDANALAVKQANIYLYADGTEIARDGEVNRENVPLDQVSQAAQHAVLAAEDRDFYSESAIDPKAVLRGGWRTVTGKGKQSGSTITQQYVKNYYLGQEQTVTRKVKEFFISIKLDRNESKDKILEGYLNTSFFGRNAYGIQAAAQAYYGVNAKDLDPARAAYLAALVNAPSEYDVSAHPENRHAAEARWNYVLDGMVKKGWLSASERTGLKFPAPRSATVPTGMSGQRGYLVRAVKDYLAKNKILDEDELSAGGYRITTTLQKSKQDAFVKAVDEQLIDKLDKKNNKTDRYVRAGGASVDPKTGEVVAMYGGIDYVKQYTNNATRRDFQVGSTFKPFVLTSAVQNESTTQDSRTITPNTLYDGTNKRPVQGWNGGHYAPENEDQQSYGDITVREATDKSVNAVYAQMAVDVGSDKVKETALALGLPADTPELIGSPSIALGVAQASVLDMAQAYATLANHGKHGTYTIIKKITKDGANAVALPGHGSTASQAVSREAADTTTAVLQSVVQNGTGAPAQAIDRPAAAKTGTAENDQAAWFAGYTPDLATVVSVMGQDPDTAAHKPLYGALGLPRINGSGAPGSIWAQYMGDALKGTPVSDFDLKLQPGADESQAPPSGSAQSPGTGDDTGASPGTGDDGQDTRGQSTHGQSQDPGQSTGTPGDSTGGTPTDGGTGGGTPGGPGGDTGATDGTGGTPPTGGTTEGGGTPGGGGTPTTGGPGGGGAGADGGTGTGPAAGGTGTNTGTNTGTGQ
ncbi:transglycosylase domain-containing protein [Streptomyces sp. SAT1]|uniref:transglycosylase domain-containing protein n=1 Tax=Streptomyces sp. SAT1 TaxID=1849967 RepID=UPI000A68145C|nr:transglycosylase domain-containing protein [Streptomyces sp. SAT1]